MNKREWWNSLTAEQRAALKDKPDVARAMYENRDWKGFGDLIFELRDMVSDVGRVRVRQE